MKDPRQEIIIAAYNQFRQYGFKHVTMEDLARHTGVSKKTLYELFADKDELVLESVKYMLATNECETEEAFKKSKNAVDQIISILVIMERMVRGLNPVCYIDLQRHYAEAYRYLQQHKESYLYHCISDNLRQGIAEGLYRDDIDIDIITRFRMESAMIVFQNNLFPQEKYNIVKVNTEIFSNYMYGVATLKGHKLITSYLSKLKK